MPATKKKKHEEEIDDGISQKKGKGSIDNIDDAKERGNDGNIIHCVAFTLEQFTTVTFESVQSRDEFYENMPKSLIDRVGLTKEDFYDTDSYDKFVKDLSEKGKESMEQVVTPCKESNSGKRIADATSIDIDFDTVVGGRELEKKEISVDFKDKGIAQNVLKSDTSPILKKWRQQGGSSQVEIIVRRFKNIPGCAKCMPIVIEFHARNKESHYWLHQNKSFLVALRAWKIATDDQELDQEIPSIPNCFRIMEPFHFTNGNDSFVKFKRGNYENYWEGLYTFVRNKANNDENNKALLNLVGEGIQVMFADGSAMRTIYAESQLGESTNVKLQEGLNPHNGQY
jgi:hypothetical protein